MRLQELFTKIANAIRSKKLTSAQIPATNFPDEILSITSSGETISEIDVIISGNYNLLTEEECEKILNGTYEYVANS